MAWSTQDKIKLFIYAGTEPVSELAKRLKKSTGTIRVYASRHRIEISFEGSGSSCVYSDYVVRRVRRLLEEDNGLTQTQIAKMTNTKDKFVSEIKYGHRSDA